MNVEVLIEDENWDSFRAESIKEAVEAVLNFVQIEDADKTEVCFLCTNDAEVQVLNKTFRGIDKPTNVLSFPATDYNEDDSCCCCDHCDCGCSNAEKSGCGCCSDDEDEDEECMPDENILGSIAFAFETIYREAEEQGKTFEDHLKHLTIHGMLHLLGYDHIEDADAEKMEALEVKILDSIGIANPYQE